MDKKERMNKAFRPFLANAEIKLVYLSRELSLLAANEKADDKQAEEGNAKEEKQESKADTEAANSSKKSTIEPEAVIDLASEDKEKEPRALHKTSSIFLRNLAPTITKAEVEAVGCDLSKTYKLFDCIISLHNSNNSLCFTLTLDIFP